MRIVAVDSNPGRLGEAELTALDEALRDSPPMGTIVAMHHPPFPAAIPDLIRQNFDRTADFARIVRGRVRLVLTGHYHQTSAGSIAGVPVWTAPALSYQRNVTTAPDGGWAVTEHRVAQGSLVELGEEDFRATIVRLDTEAAVSTPPGRTS